MSTSRRAYFAFVVVCVVWGTTYLAIRIALETIPPLLMAAVRWIAAGSILTAALKLRGERLPRPAAWPALGLLGVLLLGLATAAWCGRNRPCRAVSPRSSSPRAHSGWSASTCCCWAASS